MKELSALWLPDVPFVLVGASAINCYLPNPRGTQDMDVTLAVALEDLPAGLDRLPGWKRHPVLEHEWHGPGNVQVDLIPAGAALLARGSVAWPSGHTMSLVGFDHVFVRKRDFDVDGVTIAVAELEVIALLKVVAYLDRPSEREHDLQDLMFIMDEYIAADDERRWRDELISLQLEYEVASAYLLGKDMAGFLTPRDRAALARFWDCLHDDSDATLSRALRLAPPACRGSEEFVRARFDALARGLKP